MPLNNENNNECCKCTTPEIHIELNQQGPQGRQGNPGVDGVSPEITVAQNTNTSYVLKIEDANGSFTTPNLKANLPLGGVDGQMLVKLSNEDGVVGWEGNIDNLVTVDSEQTITGNKSFSAPIKTNTIEATDGTNLLSLNGGKVSLGTPANVSSPLVSNVNIKGNSVNIDGKYFTFTDLLNSPNITYTVLHSGNLKNYIQAGNNITIDKTSTGITISSTGGGEVPDNVAILTEDQTFTGHNYFNGQVNFNGTVQFTNQQVNIPKLYSSNKITGANISLDSAGQSFKFPCEQGTLSLSATSGDEAGTSAGLYITGAGIDNKRLLTEGDAYTLPQANATTLGGIKANEKTDEDTQAVNIDPATGLLYTKAGGGGTIEYIDGGNAQTDEPAVLKASNVDLGIYPTNNIYSTNENIIIE